MSLYNFDVFFLEGERDKCKYDHYAHRPHLLPHSALIMLTSSKSHHVCCVEGERDKYKGLARRLKEERNQFKEMLEAKNNEQAELQVIERRLASFKKMIDW